jgi:hypothetical protein
VSLLVDDPWNEQCHRRNIDKAAKSDPRQWVIEPRPLGAEPGSRVRYEEQENGYQYAGTHWMTDQQAIESLG